MKKFIAVVAVLALTLVASVAMAEVTVSGSVDIRSLALNNTTDMSSKAGYQSNTTQSRFRVNIDGKHENVKGRITFENDWEIWGSQKNSISGGLLPANSSQGVEDRPGQLLLCACEHAPARMQSDAVATADNQDEVFIVRDNQACRPPGGYRQFTTPLLPLDEATCVARWARWALANTVVGTAQVQLAPFASVERFERMESALVVHLAVAVDPVTQVQVRAPGAACPFELLEDRQRAEAALGQVGFVEGVDRREGALDHIGHRQRQQPALAARRRFAQLDGCVRVGELRPVDDIGPADELLQTPVVEPESASPARLSSAAKVLKEALATLQAKSGHRTFGECVTCRHNLHIGPGSYVCGLTKEKLSSREVGKICREHSPIEESSV